MRLLIAVVVALCGIALPAGADAQSGPRNCTRTSQNLFVRDVLDEYYLWYRELPRLNPSNYATPEAYLDAARFRPLDSTFSYITSRAANDAFYGDSQFVGVGITTQMSGSEMRVLQVFPESPASEAGMARGDRIFEINGTSVTELIETGLIGGAFGASEPGVTAQVGFQSRQGVERRATLTKRVVTIPTVSLTRTFQVDGRTVGYLLFRNFVEPSYGALDEAFAALREARATELVIDLRYNGGGLVDVAVHLGGLVAGAVTEGRIFATFQHNDKHSALNEDLRFERPTQSLNLSRLFVVTTRASASASELLINSLRPHIPVFVIGDATYGKPVGQYGFAFCDKVLAPVAFALVNSDGQGDFFGGIAPTCAAPDDLEHDLGAADEASLAEAFHLLRTGTCSAPATAQRLRVRATTPPRAIGWQSVVNAH
uniref:Putative carboxy-terminal processing protease n=1 Tax=uncultured Acidobacteriota bacterium TaxID=171953 RepID=Q7X344_9BACT|nr:putative carboxy-terminal processing protease [uncultured Acidobacteriota bacterium]